MADCGVPHKLLLFRSAFICPFTIYTYIYGPFPADIVHLRSTTFFTVMLLLNSPAFVTVLHAYAYIYAHTFKSPYAQDWSPNAFFFSLLFTILLSLILGSYTFFYSRYSHIIYNKLKNVSFFSVSAFICIRISTYNLCRYVYTSIVYICI